jgi:hypothetical protein
MTPEENRDYDLNLTKQKLRTAEDDLHTAHEVIAWANKALFGSHGFFLDVDPHGNVDLQHLSRAIDEVKARAAAADTARHRTAADLAELQVACIDATDPLCLDDLTLADRVKALGRAYRTALADKRTAEREIALLRDVSRDLASATDKMHKAEAELAKLQDACRLATAWIGFTPTVLTERIDKLGKAYIEKLKELATADKIASERDDAVDRAQIAEGDLRDAKKARDMNADAYCRAASDLSNAQTTIDVLRMTGPDAQLKHAQYINERLTADLDRLRTEMVRGPAFDHAATTASGYAWGYTDGVEAARDRLLLQADHLDDDAIMANHRARLVRGMAEDVAKIRTPDEPRQRDNPDDPDADADCDRCADDDDRFKGHAL